MRRDLLLIGTGGVVAAGVGWAVRDYRAWRALGPGGLPASWVGWWRMMGLRLAKRDPFAPAAAGPGPALLSHLPHRRGPRPRVAPHPVPHRQLDAHAPAAMIRRTAQMLRDRVVADPARLGLALSRFEKRHEAVTLHPECRRHADAVASRGEVAHVHPSDGSLHMILSSADMGLVIERGWGERHGLAGVRLGLPPTYTLIYAPRDNDELATVALILDASIAHMMSDPDHAADEGRRD